MLIYATISCMTEKVLLKLSELYFKEEKIDDC